ncbi:hypothetical protein O6H91_03G118600 [Diphasiastrum complanatum]|uniref:Uncharacterized protein n=1 Tax=Diphasiastrum complanatum TaxID=34168 RepID=A0ACC2EAY1_DIPCM|nr:hypothetical protein O6H91_03G118600 [Diphasiastrum complanatum]
MGAMALLPLHNASSSFSFSTFTNSFSPLFAMLATASPSFSCCFGSSIHSKALNATVKSSCHAQQRPEPVIMHNRIGVLSPCLQQHHHCPSIVYAAAPSGQDAVTAIKPGVPSPPFNVLITGSTKGVGYALAREFLVAGDRVIICSRSDERVRTTLQDLTKEYGKHQVLGKSCDVRDSNSIRELIAFAKSSLGYVDIWINNAGSNAYTFKPLVETSDAAINEIVETNMIGVMICCREVCCLWSHKAQPNAVYKDFAGRTTDAKSKQCHSTFSIAWHGHHRPPYVWL